MPNDMVRGRAGASRLKACALGVPVPRRYIAAMEITESEPARLPILIAPHAMLRQKARPVRPEDTAAVRILLPRMFAAMYAAPGIGLAAPQVEVGLRLTIIDLMEDEIRAPITLINPQIIAASDTLVSREEGCLSLPNQYAEVVRPQSVRVRYQDLDGGRHELEAEGLLATCLQHEIDHLDGILFVDHLSALKRNMLMRRLAKEQRTKAAG